MKHRIYSFIENKAHSSKDPRTFSELLKGDKAGLWRYRIRDCRVI